MKVSIPSARPVVTVLSIAVLVAIWQAGAAIVGSEIVLPAPGVTVREALRLAHSDEYGRALLATLIRGLSGFGLAFAAGLPIGFAAGRRPLVLHAVRPLLNTIQATPVLAVILLALIWFRTETVPVFTAFLMSFPVVCLTAMEGTRAVDSGLLEMARVFRVPRVRKFSGLYLPSMAPYLTAASATALGLCWKVVVATEVLSLPDYGIGSGLYDAKIVLDTPRVFAWTLTAVALCFATDALLARLSQALQKGRP